MNIKFKQVYPTELLIEVKPIESEFSTLYLVGDLRISHLFIKQLITKLPLIRQHTKQALLCSAKQENNAAWSVLHL